MESEASMKLRKSNPMTFFFASILTLMYVLLICSQLKATSQKKPIIDNKNIPATLETFSGHAKSAWERVNGPGFGNDNNIGIITMAEYRGRLYAMTRNDVEGAEVWRTNGSSWEQVLFPNGETNGIYGNRFINNLFADMVVFRGKLYFGFSSGFQGGTLKSTGCEIWRYDGTAWEPVISDKKDTEESGTITAIEDCDDADGSIKGKITDETKNWVLDQWAGGILQIISGDGKHRKFDIIGNTANTLIIQKNDISGETGTEYTICDNVHYVNPFPPYEFDSGSVQVGDRYGIGTGIDESGYGSYWNRAINTMIIFDNKMFVTTGLNYEYGAQAWYTEDGESWVLTQPAYSLDVFHTDPTFPNGRKPVIVTILSLCPSSVSGSEVLYAGGTGSSGNAGACSRMAKLTETGWEMIVDANVDENDTGTNENGFGDGMDCTMFNGNFMPWSLADFKNKLYVGINSIAGARVVYTSTGSSADGSWFYSAGGDSDIPNGFNGATSEGISATMNMDFYNNIVANIYATDDFLYAGLITAYVPVLGRTKDKLAGSQIWRTGDGKTWHLHGI
jgi:hypothetical protein